GYGSRIFARFARSSGMTTEIEAALYDKLAVIARLDRAIQYSRDDGDGAEAPRDTGSPAFADDDR
ncbi:MAG: hypothetical protein E6848_14205, partial [Bradyrhizobium sp.]|nr:hypothetical protein [Bradyrhizobium sp.]